MIWHVSLPTPMSRDIELIAVVQESKAADAVAALLGRKIAQSSFLKNFTPWRVHAVLR